MKKLFSSKKSHTKKSPTKELKLLSFSKHSLLLIVSVTAMVGGVYAIAQSFAATPTYTTIVVTLKNSQTGALIPGGNVGGSGFNVGLMSNTGDRSACNVTSQNPTNWGFSCKVHTYTAGVVYSSYRVWFASAPGYQTFNDPYGSSGYFGVSTNGTSYPIAYLSPNPVPQAPAPAPQPQAPAPAPQAPAPQPQAPAPQPQAQAPQPSTNSAPSRTVARARTPAPVASATSSADTQPPSAPTSLSAVSQGGAVALSWTASVDNLSVASYLLERSVDGQTWSVLSDSIVEVIYTDSTASFNTKYQYRVSSKDTAGNVSDYAQTEITTSSFEANAFADKESTITSEDKVVSVKIPAGALSVDANCKISTPSDEVNGLGDNYSVLAGAYNFECKDKDGNVIDKYNKPVEFTVTPPESKSTPQIFAQTGDQWEDSKLKYDGKVKGFSFTTDNPNSFAVVAKSGGTNMFLLILGIIILLLAIVGIILWLLRRRRAQQEQSAGYPLDYFDQNPGGGPPNYPNANG